MAESQSFHEDFTREEKIEGSSDRGFGLVFAAFFALIAVAKLWIGNSLWLWWLTGAAATLAVALLRPVWLAPFNRLWMKLGLLLFKVISPLVMGFMFFIVITPIGLLLRTCKKDILRRKIDAQISSYWILREPPGPAPETMKNQF